LLAFAKSADDNYSQLLRPTSMTIAIGYYQMEYYTYIRPRRERN